jgi:hypothetical protein
MGPVRIRLPGKGLRTTVTLSPAQTAGLPSSIKVESPAISGKRAAFLDGSGQKKALSECVADSLVFAFKTLGQAIAAGG